MLSDFQSTGLILHVHGYGSGNYLMMHIGHLWHCSSPFYTVHIYYYILSSIFESVNLPCLCNHTMYWHKWWAQCDTLKMVAIETTLALFFAKSRLCRHIVKQLYKFSTNVWHQFCSVCDKWKYYFFEIFCKFRKF